MNIGDLVVRSYAQAKIVPGIIVEESHQVFSDDIEYTETDFTVQWSDGSQSRESIYELEPFNENMVDYLQGNITFEEYHERSQHMPVNYEE